MGFATADLPEIDPAEFRRLPFYERMRLLQTHWAEYGFGSPKQIHLLYVIKLVIYIGGGLLIARFTTGLGDFGTFTDWWTEPVFYQKLLVWTVFFEVIGLGSSSGPLAFKFAPMIGGPLYYGRTGTLRVPPWHGRIPGTAGDQRTLVDVALYWATVATLVYLMVIPGSPSDRAPDAVGGLLPAVPLLLVVAFIALGGLRDMVVFLSSRPEQYLPPLVVVATFPFVDMVVALKILIVCVWIGAGISKFGPNFTSVIPPMVSNTPWIGSRRFKRALYRDFPHDLRPSRLSWFMGHVLGTLTELALPLILLFSGYPTITWLAVAGIVTFHLFITSTFPLAVPLEWNIFFCFAAVWLFGMHHASDGFAVTDMDPALLALTVFAGVIMPIIGNLKPEWVSFLISMRQYAGNWASAQWSMRDRSVEEKLNQHITKASKNQIDQISPLFGEDISELLLQKGTAWRMMHTQGRALITLLDVHSGGLDDRVVREAEFICNSLVGWNFGDGHLHDERLIEAVQQRCQFAPGDLIVAFTESMPIGRDRIEYRVIDAALGVVERGTYRPSEAAATSTWLADGLLDHTVTWTAPGYQRPARPAGQTQGAL